MRLSNTSETVIEQGDREARVRGYSEISTYHWQSQGFASKAPAGSKALVLRVGDNNVRPASVFAHENLPPPVELGDREVVVFAEDTVIHVRNGGLVEIRGNLRVLGDVRVRGDVITDAGVSLNGHIHSGVRAGPNNTGAPVT